MAGADGAALDNRPKSDRGAEASSGNDQQDGETEFRTVTHRGRRFAIRLEPVFWKVLELAAKHRRTKLTPYVGEILTASGDTQNRTSVLRVHAVSWLSRRLLDSTTQGFGQKSIDAISAASTQPVFLLGRDNKLTGHNAAFYEMLRTLSDEVGINPSENLSVAFKRDLDGLKSALSGSRDKFIEDKIVIRIGAKSFEKTVRVAALESAAGQPSGFYVFVC